MVCDINFMYEQLKDPKTKLGDKLYYAAALGNLDLVKYLVSKVKRKYINNAFDGARFWNQHEVMDYLNELK